jgi:hypothetical protein
MMKKLTTLSLSVGLLTWSWPAGAEQSTQADLKELAVTVYNDNLGLVSEVRNLQLGSGMRELEYADVASSIDATSVSLHSLSAPNDLHILEQNYEYDLLTPSRILEKFVGQEVEMHTPSAVTKATLLSTAEGPVYKIGDKIYIYPPGNVVLPKVPPNLVAHPTLKWLLQNDRNEGPQRTEVSYLTSGMSWRANYVVVASADDKRSSLNGWVTLTNQSGANFPNAQLTLVAGDVNRVRSENEYPSAARSYAAEDRAGGAPQFAERALFEYHSYKLNRLTTLKQNQTKQLSLLSAADIPTEKVYRYDGGWFPIWYQNSERRSQKVDVYLEMMNSQKNHMGMPLPKGTIRVYQYDPDHHLQFIGEDAIDHTPRDEKVRIKMGQAFDLVGERRQMSYHVLGPNLYETSYEVSLRNHKNEPVTIYVTEHLGGDWEITQESHPHRKVDAFRVDFPIRVAANAEEKLQFTVRTRY